MTGPQRQDNQDPALFGQTPWQTVGPFFHYALPWKGCADLVGSSELGARLDLFPSEHYVMAETGSKAVQQDVVIDVYGQVRDGDGAPVPDAMVEIWQGDRFGRYDAASDGSGFSGFGRSSTSEDGFYRFRTIRPGAVTDPDHGVLAPHIAIGVQGRGLIKRLVTRLYFQGAPENGADPILALVPQGRRDTLLAARTESGWRLDIVLQGPDETVFFEL